MSKFRVGDIVVLSKEFRQADGYEGLDIGVVKNERYLVHWLGTNEEVLMGEPELEISKDERNTLPEDLEEYKKIADVEEFDLDPCCNIDSKCGKVGYTILDDGLSKPWFGNVFVNPPFSNIPEWVIKAWDEVIESAACKKIVMVIPANRTEQPFWQEQIELNRDKGFEECLCECNDEPVRVMVKLTSRFLPKRRSFSEPGGKELGSPMFGCVLLIWEKG